MVKGWRDLFNTKELQDEFDLFFKEFNQRTRVNQAEINIFVFNELIKLRSELKQLKKEKTK